MGTQNSKIVGQTSWPHALTPILAAVVVRYAAPNTGKKQILYLSILLFFTSFILGIFTNAWGRSMKCNIRILDPNNIKASLAPALAPAFLSMFNPLGSYIGLSVMSVIPVASQALTILETAIGKNVVFGQVLVATFFSFIGGMVGVASAIRKAC